MGNSIEKIWKEGFLKSDALIAPKLNNLYTQKSKHIIDKFNNMFRINIIAIVAGSLLVIPFTYWNGIPYLGVFMFFILNTLAYINYKLWKSLDKVDKNVNSFQYLKSFDEWMKKQKSINRKFARIMYPAFFTVMILSIWLGDFGGTIPGQELINEIISNYPDTLLIFGLPAYGLIGFIIIIVILIIFGGKIYNLDVNLVYGRIFTKLDELVSDIEELRA